MKYIVYNNSGTILRTGNCPISMVHLQAGENEFVMDGEADDHLNYIENGEIKEYTEEELNRKNNIPFGYIWKMPEKTYQKIASDSSIYSYYENEVLIKQSKALAETDWTQTLDQPEVIREIWKPYREALRNIKYQPDYPFNVVWPHKPY